MKVNRRALHEALSILVRVADYKSTIQALRCVKLDAKDGQLRLTATNLDQTLTAEIPGEGDLTICLPAKALAQLAKPEPKTSGDLDIEPIDGSIVAIKAEGVVVRLATMTIEDFPSENDDEFNLVAMWPAGKLADSLAFCTPAVSTDETRPHICCISLDEVMAATDGHRLHTATLPSQLSEPILLPVPTAKILQRILKGADNIVIARSEKSLKLRVGIYTLETKLVDSTFPPIDQVIPKRHDTRLVVDADQFAKVVKRVGMLSNTRGVKMIVNGRIELSSSDEECEANVIVEPLENNHDGEDIVMGLNMAFLFDAMGKEKGNVSISLAGPLDPIRVDHTDGRLSVIMPMRI
jgi:DNA polymerase-3 subunit beta